MSSVAVVIPSWNTLEHIEPCIDSLRQEEGLDCELLVVDNGSTDGSVDFLRRREIDHVALPQNVGFAKAVNLGARETKAPLVLVLNADVTLERGCVASLAAAMQRDASLGGVQPKIVSPPAGDGLARIYSLGQALTIAATAYELGAGEIDDRRPDEDSEIFGVCGAVCLLRRELFSDLGGYDERYFAFYEDVDLNARARLAGWHFRCVPKAVAIHVGHAGWGKQRQAQAFNVRLTVRNRACTGVKAMPAHSLPWVALATTRTLLASPVRRVGVAALSGAWGFLGELPRLLRERRQLRSNDVSQLDRWLVRRPIDRVGRHRAWRRWQ